METEVRHPGLVRKPRASILVAAAALLLFPTTQLLASSATWDGDSAVGVPGDGVNWTNADNWSENGVADVLPNSSDDLTFGGGTIGQINLDGNQYASSLNFTAGFTLGAPDTSYALNISTGDISVDPSVVATINAEVSGGALTVSGGGTLVIFKDNSYNPTTVTGSTLLIDGTSSASYDGFTTDSASTISINAPNTISGTITNAGTFNVKATTTSSGYETITNTGTFTVASGQTFSNNSGSFTQSAGTLTINGSLSLDGGTFNDNGGTIIGAVNLASDNYPTLSFGATPATGGTFNFIGTTTSTNTYYSAYIEGSSIPAGVTVNIEPSNATTVGTMELQLPSTFTNAGTLNLSATGLNHNIVVEGSNLTNTGTLNINPGPTADGQREFYSSVNNSGTFNVNASTTIQQPATNSGSVVIAANKILGVDEYTQSAGTLTINGSLSLDGGTFNDNGGTITGAVNLASDNYPTLSFGATPATGGTFNFIGTTTSTNTYYSAYIEGSSIPAGVTVNIEPSNATTVGTMELQLPSTFTNAGTLNLSATGQNHNIVVEGSTLTNTGTLNINPGPTADGGRTLDVNLINSGNININASTITESIANSGNININASTITGSITNSGNITLAVGKSLSTGINSVTQSSGTLTLNGNIRIGSTFYDNGGAIAGNGAVLLASIQASPTLVISATPAAGGTFDFVGADASTNGAPSTQAYLNATTIPADVTLNLAPTDASGGIQTLTVDLGNSATNAGTINLAATGQNHNVIFAGDSLINTGTINSDPGPTADGSRSLELQLSNLGTININANTSVSASLTNTGTINIAAGKTLNVGGGSTFAQSSGTLTINGALDITGGGINGAIFQDNGGTISGPVTFVSGVVNPPQLSINDPLSNATFDFVGNPSPGGLGNATINGSIPDGATVNIEPSTSYPGSLALTVRFIGTNAGTINLLALNENNSATINGTFTNTGTVNINPGPTADGGRTLTGVNNSGVINVNASTEINSLQNSGDITIATGKTLSTGGLKTDYQTAGTLTVTGTFNWSIGTVRLDGGTINIPGSAQVGNFTNDLIAPGASLNIPGGNLAITPRTTTTQNILDLSSISITSGGQFDLTNNDLIVNYSDPSVASSIQSDLASGYAAGAWDGPGIISSTAASQTNHATALGYIDTPGVDIEIKYTWLGDTDLSGTVDNTDLLAMSPTGTTWSTGDFNYDGKVNADDYALFMLGSSESGGANISTLPEPIGAAGMLLTMLAAIILNRYPKSFRRRDI